MTATIKGRVLDYAGRPIESSFTLAPIGAPKALSSQTILTAGVLATSTRNGSLSAVVSAGEYTLTLHSGVCLTADVVLNSGETYGLATLLGVNGDDSYGIIISDDGDVMTIPDSYLVDEDGDRYQLGGVQAYTVEGTDAQIIEAVGSKVEDIASARIEELVKVEVEESAGPIIEAAVATEVEPVRGDLATLSSEVGACEEQAAALAGRVTSVELDVAGVEEDLTYHEESLERLRADVNSNASKVSSLESRTTALESWKTTANSRLAAVEAREDKDTVYDDTALTKRVATLEAREDKDTVYDDTDLRNAVEQAVTDVAVLEETVTSNSTSIGALDERVAGHETRITTLEGQMSTAVVSILKLGADEEIPADTPAGTLVVRVAE